MGKFKMPTVKAFLKKKKIYDKRKDPVWVYLEQEMRQNEDKKPYNYKVGAWLKFLKDLRYYFYCEAKRKYKRLYKDAGPPWYIELSITQRETLFELKDNIHKDLIQNVPVRVTRDIWRLGISLKFEGTILLRAMRGAKEDPAIFLWYLYEHHFKEPPSRLRLFYDMNAMILISCLVMLDLEECLDLFNQLVPEPMKPPPAPTRVHRKGKYWEPRVKYGMYLQKLTIPVISNYPDEIVVTETPKPVYSVRLKSQESYERLALDHSFIQKRIERNTQMTYTPRICKYKFWECPAWVHNTDPKMREYVMKLRIFKLHAKPKHNKYRRSPCDNEQYQIGNVTYIGNKPVFLINNLVMIPTGYSPINGGQVQYKGECITLIHGHYQSPEDNQDVCDFTCNCLEKWGPLVKEYSEESKCKCNHFYDFKHEGRPKETYFHKPTRYTEGWFDRAKIYQFDPTEDFVKDVVKNALKSESTVSDPNPPLNTDDMKIKEIVKALLSEISHTPLIIPHLPLSHLLVNLQEWVRKRLQGPLSPYKKRKLLLRAERRWLDLSHMDFRARAYNIPFTLSELSHFNWNHRRMLQTLFNTLLNSFVMRNRNKQVEQTRMFWSTMHYEIFPSKSFLELFFTYMPGTLRDTYIVNPHNAALCKRKQAGGKSSCPLDLPEIVRM